MQALHGVGLNGMMSCQNQRVFLPTGLGMTAMAAALWNENADFDTVAADYFRCAFGSDGSVMQQYMQDLSDVLFGFQYSIRSDVYCSTVFSMCIAVHINLCRWLSFHLPR